MNINEEVTVVVTEPWDFASPEGDNKFSGTIINFTKTIYGDAYLIKVINPFKFNGKNIGHVVAVYRNIAIKSNGLNISFIPDNIVEKFHDFDNIKDSLKFIIIGSIKVK